MVETSADDDSLRRAVLDGDHPSTVPLQHALALRQINKKQKKKKRMIPVANKSVSSRVAFLGIALYLVWGALRKHNIPHQNET